MDKVLEYGIKICFTPILYNPLHVSAFRWAMMPGGSMWSEMFVLFQWKYWRRLGKGLLASCAGDALQFGVLQGAVRLSSYSVHSSIPPMVSFFGLRMVAYGLSYPAYTMQVRVCLQADDLPLPYGRAWRAMQQEGNRLRLLYGGFVFYSISQWLEFFGFLWTLGFCSSYLSPNGALLAAGIVSKCISHPFWLVSVRARSGKYESANEVVNGMLRDEPLSSFFHGLFLRCAEVSLYVAIYKWILPFHHNAIIQPI